MLILASAGTVLALALVVALILRYRFAAYESLIYIDREAAADLAATRRASQRTAA